MTATSDAAPASGSAPAAPTGARVLGGGAWLAAERVVCQGAQLAIFVVAARILTPAEFGVFALVSACAYLALRVAEGGWAPYVMAWSGDARKPAQVLLVAMLSGAAAAALGGGVAAALPWLGAGAEVTRLVALFALWLALAVTSTALKGIMVWQGRLRASALAEIAGEAVGLVVAVAALRAGLGVISLVVGRLATQGVHVAASFAVTRMRPRGGLRGPELRELLVVAGQLFASRLIFHLRIYSATFLVGAFLGPAAVGFYRAAERLVSAVAEVVAVPTTTLAWTLFRQTRDANGGTTAGFQGQADVFFRVLLGVTAPIFLWLALMADDLVTGLLGSQWGPALPLVVLLAVARLIYVPNYGTEPIMSLAGEVRRLPRVQLVYLLATVAAVSAAAPFGLIPLGVAQIAVALVITGVTMRLLGRHAGISWAPILGGLPRLLPPLGLGVAVLLLLRDAPAVADWPALVRALVLPLPAGLVYALALLAVEPALRRPLHARLARRPRRRPDPAA